ncbi:Similar to AAEL010953: Protein OPI10 homolog (Aedes aegypti) [Cotesia congregata]|uniref:Similar to AAEL010953: Protein OPI10 homolog (Aedes aegypti) n=1 Tax=Cotesia congregata TaxID=51543 RepID=A0A8J2HK44_COTCN|nr:Similar to AAEL010953: Protein OPI10 homolog (Aedes aegypti) [Cotesia congregata]
MLGIIVSGRLVQTDFQQISENQFLINVPDADNVNHIVIFLTGYISNNKPSAIFRISDLKKNHEFENANLGIFGAKISHSAQIGISVEPLSAIEPLSALVASTTTESHVKFAQKMIINFMNYVSSFSVTQSQMTPNPSENFVPLSSVQGWYETFERRLQQNPNFWKQL